MKCLYGFGFETPRQRLLNDGNGRDDEDSGCLFIECESAGEALRWGRVVAEAFMKWLYSDDSISWAESGYADWVNASPEAEYTPEQLANIACVPVGKMSDLSIISGQAKPHGPMR